MSDKGTARPVLGHDHIVKFIRSAIRNGKLAHAYLLVGPEKVGKGALADFFIQAVFC